MSEDGIVSGRSNWYDSVLMNRKEMQPLPTEVTPKLDDLSSIRAVIFDIYGTLIISGSGDVGAADQSDRGDMIETAIRLAEISIGRGRLPTIDDLHQQIRLSNEARKGEDCPKPEVDIVDVWRKTLRQCGIDGFSTRACHRLAAGYESLANPTWPMPGARDCLQTLSSRGLDLGIVSNAQGFTLPLIEDLGGDFGVNSVFDSNLCVFSNRYRQAKPGPRLFDVLCKSLSKLGIKPRQAIYVGNDRLNDVWAATEAGLRTAWFAGDRRSLRDRTDDARTANLKHDVIITSLEQLPGCWSSHRTTLPT